MSGRPTDTVRLESGPHYEVLVLRADSRWADRSDYIRANCRNGEHAEDWMHGDARSDPPEVKAQARYLFTDQTDAAIFRMRFG